MLRMRRRRAWRVISKIALVLAAIVLLIVLLDHWIRPTLTDRLSYQVKGIVTLLVNETVTEELEKLDVTYQKMIQVTRDGSGTITALQADTVLINRLKSDITVRITEKLQGLSGQDFGVSLGTLSGMKLLSGRGPLVRFRLLPEGVVQTALFHQFSGAGVNQTLHRIYMQITVDVSAVTPGFSMQSSISTDMELAQTIIVGEVPEFFGQIALG